MAMSETCPFCARLGDGVGSEQDLVTTFPDAFPVSPGHTLVVPRRHVVTYLEATEVETAALWREVDRSIERLTASYRPDGFNVGVNVGPAAGQTVMHLHLHVIPRYTGDMADPRGGVRHVIPERARYWS